MLYCTRLHKSYTSDHYLFCTILWNRYFFLIVLISNHLFFNSLTKTGIIYNDSFPLLLIFIISLINNFSISVCWRMYQSTITKNVDLSDHVSLFLCIIIFIYTHISIWLHVQWSRDTVFRRTYFWFEFILLIVIKRIGEKFKQLTCSTPWHIVFSVAMGNSF